MFVEENQEKADKSMDANNGITITFLDQNIRYLRKRLNISQEELANRIGLNRGNIASYENGSAEPKLCNLLKLAHIFRVTISDLTQKDLTQETAYQEAQNGFFIYPNNDKQEVMSEYLLRSEELRKVIESLHTCHSFKVKSLDELSKEAKVMHSNFEQMYDLALNALHDLEALLDFFNNPET